MKNLKPSKLKIQFSIGSSISQEEMNKIIEEIYNYVIDEAMTSIDWYFSKKNPKRIMGLLLRYGSIILVAVGGILPIVIAIYKDCNINSAWSAVAVATAVLMIGIDKFGGFTSGWIRYVLAAQKLAQSLEEFRFIWKEEKLKLVGKVISADDSLNLINKCKDFLLKVQLIVSEETQKWVAEFQSALSDIEAATKAAAESAKETAKIKEKGAILIQVVNGSLCDNQWTLEIDDKVISKNSGTSFALSDLNPGIIKIKISGTIKGVSVQDQKPIIIKGGDVSTGNFTLA